MNFFKDWMRRRSLYGEIEEIMRDLTQGNSAQNEKYQVPYDILRQEGNIEEIQDWKVKLKEIWFVYNDLKSIRESQDHLLSAKAKALQEQLNPECKIRDLKHYVRCMRLFVQDPRYRQLCDTEEFELKGDIARYAASSVELGGIVNAVREGNKLVLEPIYTITGSSFDIKISGPLGEHGIGYWHTHPSGIPIPSKADIFPMSGMSFHTVPNIIIASNETRLYLSEFLCGLLEQTFKGKLHPFTTLDRDREINQYGGQADQQDDKFMHSMRYITFDNQSGI